MLGSSFSWLAWVDSRRVSDSSKASRVLGLESAHDSKINYFQQRS